MLFNTFEYLGFFVAVLVLAWLLVGLNRIRIWFLLAASLYFYASNNGWQTLLILLTTTIDYLICLKLGRTDNQRLRKGLVVVSVVSNLGLLAWFKYANFLRDGMVHLAAAVGLKLDWVTLNIMLPVGISFYTFEALSYTIDVYRRKIPAERDWSRLAFLVTFFPHLIAGPIVRAADFFPQMNRRAWLDRGRLETALALIMGGLVKKIVMADHLASFADMAFAAPTGVGTAHAWLGIYAFAFQIYFDFSGYTDIAVGCAKLLGYELPENFRRPYAATSVTDFWRRWHMSLSTWLRDYLYISLGGNRMKTRWGVYRNLMVTMLLGGLWHGAAWTFVFWGFLHGLYLSFERFCGIKAESDGRGGGRALVFMQRLLVFHLVVFTWIPFRAKNLPEMGQLFRVLFNPVAGPPLTIGAMLAGGAMLVAWWWQVAGERFNTRERLLSLPLPVKAVGYSIAAVTVMVLGSETRAAFIYFRF